MTSTNSTLKPIYNSQLNSFFNYFEHIFEIKASFQSISTQIFKVDFDLLFNINAIQPINQSLYSNKKIEFRRSSFHIDKPKRHHELWKHTCLECFLKPQNDNIYYEINVNAEGFWNIYQFTNYRENMQESTHIKILDFQRLSKVKSANEINLKFNLIFESQFTLTNLDFSLNAVIENMLIKDSNQNLDYYAIKHSQSKPDFHHFNNFIPMK